MSIVKSTSPQHATQLAIVAALLSQEHARILLGREATDHEYIEPLYLAELLFLNEGLGNAVLNWAVQENIDIEQGAPKIDPVMHELSSEVIDSTGGVEHPTVETREELLALVPDVEQIIADTAGAAGINLEDALAAAETAGSTVKVRVKV
jgi:hypothetical protein